MPYEMKSLKHNGIYVPPYDFKGFSIKVENQVVKLQPEAEQMAVAWARKAQSQTSPPDKIYYSNFIKDFLQALRQVNPGLNWIDNFCTRHLRDLEAGAVRFLLAPGSIASSAIDFKEITDYLAKEQAIKLNMTKEEKKKLTQVRKEKRDKLKEKYGFAILDGKKIEVANWTAEPSCLFAGRGDHPRRGKWKKGPKEEDIILNLSSDAPKPEGKWKEIIWDPTCMYLAKWEDKLFGKIKYVWFHDSAFLKQEREKEKFKKAEKLGKTIPQIEAHIADNLDSENPERRMIATVSWLILTVNMRVGDEKDPDEADTVGAITLRPEHIKIEGERLHFDFLGKDAVHWIKTVEAPENIIRNVKEYSSSCKEYMFEKIDSKKVNRFLSEKMLGLTAKVFRTWKCTETVADSLQDCKAKKEDPEHRKLLCAKTANLQAAIIANHKRKVPEKFDERLAKKEAKVKELQETLSKKTAEGKNVEYLSKRLEKAKIDVRLTKDTREYNLGTSLKSYIDPMAYVKWAEKVDFNLEKLYPKTLRRKYEWALGKMECDQETATIES